MYIFLRKLLEQFLPFDKSTWNIMNLLFDFWSKKKKNIDTDISFNFTVYRFWVEFYWFILDTIWSLNKCTKHVPPPLGSNTYLMFISLRFSFIRNAFKSTIEFFFWGTYIRTPNSTIKFNIEFQSFSNWTFVYTRFYFLYIQTILYSSCVFAYDTTCIWLSIRGQTFWRYEIFPNLRLYIKYVNFDYRVLFFVFNWSLEKFRKVMSCLTNKVFQS